MTNTPTTLYCANHPETETNLRCSRCEKPICTKCAVLTPTGYKCKECVREQQKVFDTSEWYDLPIAFVIAFGISFAGSFLTGILSFFMIFIAPVIGAGIAEVVRIAVRKRRSRRLTQITVIATIVGSLIVPLFALLGGNPRLMTLVWSGVYTVLETSSVTYRMAGIRVR